MQPLGVLSEDHGEARLELDSDVYAPVVVSQARHGLVARSVIGLRRRARAIVFAAVALALLAAWWSAADLVYSPALRHVVRAAPAVTSGDEPHYLLVVDSLLADHDLALTDDYARVRRGGLDAGERFAGVALDHHTLVVEAGRTRLWSDIYDWQHRVPCSLPGCVGFALRDGAAPPVAPFVERSAHPPALAILSAALLAPFSRSPIDVERRMPLVIIFFAWLAALGVFVIARRSGLGDSAAAATALLLVGASPWLAYSRAYFAEVPIGAALVGGLAALQARRPVLAGIAVGVAMMLKPPFALVGAAWVLERWLARERGEAVRLATTLAVAVAAMSTFNWYEAHRLVVSGQSAFATIKDARQLPATLLDLRYGLFAFVPWAPLAFVGVARGARREQLLAQIALPALFLMLLFMLDGALGATCYGCRYWVPLLPLLAIGALRAAARGGIVMRSTLASLAVVAALIAVPGALFYRAVWDQPPYHALSLLVSRW